MTEFNAITNTSNIVNQTIINNTEITKGYALDDATLVAINFYKANNYGNIKALAEQIYYDNWYANVDAVNLERNSNIQLVKNADVLFVTSFTDTSGNKLNLSNILNNIHVKLNGVDMPLTQNGDEYVNTYLHCEVGDVIKIHAYKQDYFDTDVYYSLTTEYTIKEDIITAALPTVLINVTATEA